MSQHTLSAHSDPAAEAGARPAGPIVVATDGSPGAVGALRAAMELSAVDHAAVIAVAVTAPTPVVIGDYGIAMPPLDTSEVRRHALQRDVGAQIADLFGRDHDWRIETPEGDPASVIARIARDRGARAIVAGLGHHDLMSRLMGDEVALQLLRLSRQPVLAVPADFRFLPKRIALACDFGDGSLRAGRAALELFPAIAMLYVVHVAPELDVQPEALMSGITAAADLGPAFEKFIDALGVPRGIAIESITLTGKPSRALLDFVQSAHLDAVVTGSRGGGFLDRIMVGSTATSLIRGAPCTVLGVPTSYRQRVVTVAQGTEMIPAEVSAGWGELLETFTQRNAGRTVSLEVDDPEFGAQCQVSGYPFLGASWDHNDRRVELMLGELGEAERHLSRGITEVHAIDVLRDTEGRDLALRVAHGAGQTLLLIER